MIFEDKEVFDPILIIVQSFKCIFNEELWFSLQGGKGATLYFLQKLINI